MITHDEFVKKHDGHAIDCDGGYPIENPYQCMDLMNLYVVEVLGLPLNTLAAPTAYQAYLNGHPDFEKIANTPGNEPEQGDVMFWNTKVGESGHVAIYDSDWGKYQFNSFDQNWPVGSLSHMQNHDYNGVAGWLRYKYKPMTKEERKEIDAMKADIKELQEAKGSRKQLRKVRRKLGFLPKKNKAKKK